MESKLEYYSRLEDGIIRTYKEAEDDETRNAARMLMREHQLKILEWESPDFYEVYRAYREAAENGNKYIDYAVTYTPERIKAYVKIMKENGLKCFTYSSARTNATQSVQGALNFKQAGAKMEELVEVYTSHGTKAPALKFTIE